MDYQKKNKSNQPVEPRNKCRIARRPMKILILSLLFLFTAPLAHAGVTFHFEGTAKSPQAVAQILAIAVAFAKKRGWQIKDASSEKGVLKRVIEEKEKDYKGKITGIILYPHDMAEPLYLQFGEDHFVQDYIKTQFAGAPIHLDVVALFDELKPHFSKLTIDDEGEYWETRDKMILLNHIETVNKLMEGMKAKDTKARGPVKLPNGRIADVIN